MISIRVDLLSVSACFLGSSLFPLMVFVVMFSLVALP